MGSITPTAPSSLQKLYIETPCIESRELSLAAGCRIFLKLDYLQPSGSFKSRGIGHLVSLASANHPHTPLHFYCSSGGNAGLACARACLSVGHPCTIVVPHTTTQFMVAKLQALGAKVYQEGMNWREADSFLRQEVMDRNYGSGVKEVYVPPFDHPDIWEGASSLVPELDNQMQAEGGYDGVVCSVGGGGLLIGIADGLHAAGKSHKVGILAVETEGAESLAASLRQGELATLPRITSIATSLGCTTVAARAFEVAKQSNVEVAVLSDAQAAMGSVHLADLERILAEAACGVSIATCFDGSLRRGLGGGCADAQWREKRIVVVVCGGSIVSTALLEEYRAKYFAVVEKEVALQKNRLVKKLLLGTALDQESVMPGGVEKIDAGFMRTVRV